MSVDLLLGLDMFSFFKKKKEVKKLPSLDDLDLPPAPPPFAQDPNTPGSEQPLPGEELNAEIKAPPIGSHPPDMPPSNPIPDSSIPPPPPASPDLGQPIPPPPESPAHTLSPSDIPPISHEEPLEKALSEHPPMSSPPPDLGLPSVDDLKAPDDHTADLAKEEWKPQEPAVEEPPEQEWKPPQQEAPPEVQQPPVDEKAAVAFESNSVYIPAVRFKDVLTDVTVMRSELGEAAALLSKTAETTTNREKDFNKWKAHLENIQKQLTFMDKTIFQR